MRTLIFSMLVVSAIPGWSQAEDPELRAEVQALYRTWDRLIAKGDWNRLESMFDPAWVIITENNQSITYVQAKAMFGAMKAGSMRSKVIVNSVQACGDNVVAWVTQTQSFRNKVKGKTVWTSHTGRFSETLKRTPDGLKFFYTQALPNSKYWGW